MCVCVLDGRWWGRCGNVVASTLTNLSLFLYAPLRSILLFHVALTNILVRYPYGVVTAGYVYALPIHCCLARLLWWRRQRRWLIYGQAAVENGHGM